MIDEDNIYFDSEKNAYFKNSDLPVSGTVQFWHEEDNSGEIKVKKVTDYVEGKKFGTDVHYSIEGQILLTCNFKNNLLHGPIRINHPNGQPKCITQFINQKKDGKYVEFNALGNLIHESFFKNGNRHGEFKNFNEDGQLLVHMFYHEGEKHGHCKEYDNEGNLELDCTFKNGKHQGIYKEFLRGNLIQEIIYDNGNPTKTSSYKNGGKFTNPPEKN